MTGPEYGYGRDQVSIQLERKKDMKARGLPSPDDGDALALTFSEMVMPVDVPGYLNPENFFPQINADRYSELDAPDARYH